ncbi:MAG: helix-turn-helix domain-containing protein [Patescibacteria group bacterium]|nr:helix-turn-helix domain-containing protein [Patescibacteria group bacterium]
MDLEKILKQFGLNQKEASVYLAVLELGQSSVQKIARKAGIARSTTYEILESLKNKALVYSLQKHNVLNYGTEEPKKLSDFAKERAKLLEHALPEFTALYGKAKTRPTVRFYQGKEGARIMLEEILKEAKELKAFSSADDLFTVLDEVFPEFVKKRIKAKIPIKVILRESPKARERQRLGPQELREVRIIPVKYEYHGLTFMWKNKIAMFSLKADLVMVLIESEELAQMQSAMFNVIWDSLFLKQT